jgi:FecR protein/Outer membrane lipoprotein
MPAECPRLWEVDAYREGKLGARDAARFERHARVCTSCGGLLERDERLRRLARELLEDEPDELGLRRVRGEVMRELATGTHRALAPRRRWVAAAVLVGAVGLVGWRLAAPRPPAPAATSPVAVATVVVPENPPPAPPASSPEPFAASVGALAASRWTQTRENGVERVLMESGWVRVHVRPQHAGERFIVVTPDGELEVRGTTFEVTVEGGQTTCIHVDDGVVELRLRGQEPRRLGAGDMWRPPAPPIAVAASPASPPPSAPPRVEPSDRAADAYKAAMQLLVDGRNAEASAAFEAFLLAHPGAPQGEDASYLAAVALARAGRTDAAGLAAEQHLRRFPRSFHAKEAAGLVALAASQRGDCARVRAVVAERSGGEPDRQAQAALRACEGK